MDQFVKYVRAPRNMAVCHVRSAVVLERHCRSLPATNADEAELKVGMRISAILLRAFATELTLKALHYCLNSQIPKNGHSLCALFDQLGNSAVQQRIENRYRPTADGRPFRDSLEGISNAFVDWRYVHEKLGPKAQLSLDVDEAVAVLAAISFELDVQIKQHADVP